MPLEPRTTIVIHSPRPIPLVPTQHIPDHQRCTMICRFITLALLALVTVLATAAAFDESAFPDTKENRMAQAKRVLMGTPIEETLEGIVQEAIRVKGQEKANVCTVPAPRCLSACVSPSVPSGREQGPT